MILTVSLSSGTQGNWGCDALCLFVFRRRV